MTVFAKRACGIYTPDGGLSPPKFLRWGFQGGATTAIAVVGYVMQLEVEMTLKV